MEAKRDLRLFVFERTGINVVKMVPIVGSRLIPTTSPKAKNTTKKKSLHFSKSIDEAVESMDYLRSNGRMNDQFVLAEFGQTVQRRYTLDTAKIIFVS